MNKRLFTTDEVKQFADPRDHLASPTTESNFPVEHWLSLQPDRAKEPGDRFGESAYDPLELREIMHHPLAQHMAISYDQERRYGDSWVAVDLCNGEQLMVSVELPDDHCAVFLYTLDGDAYGNKYMEIDFCGIFSA